MCRHAKPRISGEWLRQGRRSVPTLPAASVTDAMPGEPSTRRFARTGTPNRTMGHGWPKMAGHGDCKMDVFRESPSCANGRAQGTGLWKVRTVFRRSDNGRPSETQPKFGSRFYEGLCLGRNYPGIAAFWNERRNRCRDATHSAGPNDAQGHEEKRVPP